LERFRKGFAPKTQPQLLAQRLRLARSVLVVFFVLLGVWFAGEVVMRLTLPADSDYPFYLDVGSIAVLAAAGGLALWLLRRRQVLVTGYMLATLLFVGISVGLILNPQHILILGGMYILPILLVGSLVGGGSTYVFAVAGMLALSLSWFQAWGRPLAPTRDFQAVESFAFLLSHIVLYFGAASILQFLSTQVDLTLEHMQDHAEQLAKLAQTDPLTGLANRRSLIEHLEREFVRARRYHRPLSLLYLDLDGFKAVNDLHGHMFGDEILRGTARCMQVILRSTDLLARMGGDEFAVLLPETTIEGAQNVAHKLRKALTAYSQQLDQVIPTLTFCGGISHIQPDDRSIDDMLIRADGAQYLAKQRGKADTCTEVELERTELEES
jgi:diguanylate cyclase (GGDEF)-like protein